MDQDERDIDLIERHVNNELSTAERKAFDARVATDPEFAEKVDDFTAILKGIKSFDSYAFSNEVEQWEREIRQEEAATREAPVHGLWKRYLAAAAAVGLLILSLFFLDRDRKVDEQQLFAAHFAPYDDVLSVRKGEGDNETLSSAMGFYNAKRYNEAIPHFLSVLEKEPGNEDASFYLGISYLADGDPVEAIRFLDPLHRESGPYQDHATWYLALANLLENDINSAKKLLGEISNEPGHDLQREAENLLDDLN